MKNSIIESRKNTRIIRNNIVAVLLSQAVIGIISYFTGAPIIAYLWGEMTENPSVLVGVVLLLLNVLFVLYLYFLAGRHFIKMTENKAVSIITVWWLSFALIICSVLGLLLKNDVLISIGFGLFNPIALSIGFAFGAMERSMFGIDAEYFVLFIAPIIPSFGLWLGTVIKKRKKATKPKVDRSIPVV